VKTLLLKLTVSVALVTTLVARADLADLGRRLASAGVLTLMIRGTLHLCALGHHCCAMENHPGGVSLSAVVFRGVALHGDRNVFQSAASFRNGRRWAQNVVREARRRPTRHRNRNRCRRSRPRPAGIAAAGHPGAAIPVFPTGHGRSGNGHFDFVDTGRVGGRCFPVRRSYDGQRRDIAEREGAYPRFCTAPFLFA